MHGVQLYGLTCPLLDQVRRHEDGQDRERAPSGSRPSGPAPTSSTSTGSTSTTPTPATACGCSPSCRTRRSKSLDQLAQTDAAATRQPAAAGRGADAAGPRRRRPRRRRSGRPTIFFGAEIDDLTDAQAGRDLRRRAQQGAASRRGSTASGLPIVDALVEAGLAKSKGEARRTVEQGGAYVNNRRIDERRCPAHGTHLASEIGDRSALRQEEVRAAAVCVVSAVSLRERNVGHVSKRARVI